jgi:hypothetical protein
MWSLKTDTDGHAILAEGKPVYVDKDGKDVPVDVPSMYQKIIDLGKESKGHREKFEGLQNQYKVVDELFTGVEDLPAWKRSADEALQAVANFNEKDWLKAEKVESMKRQMKEAHEEEKRQLSKAFDKDKDSLTGLINKGRGQIHKLVISNKFALHTLWSGEDPKTTLRPELAEAYFGKHFKVEEDEKTGELVERGYYSNGDLVYSRKKPGEPADFFEAMDEIFDQYPGKESVLRTKGGGSDSKGGGGGKPPNDGSTLEKVRAAYDKAIAERRSSDAVALKRQLHGLEMEARGKGKTK